MIDPIVIKGAASWVWNNKALTGAAVLAVALSLAVVTIKVQTARLDSVNASVTLLEAEKAKLNTVIAEHERALAAMEGKVRYDKERNAAALDSAEAIKQGRKSGDAVMAPVLRTEYERVRRLAKERYSIGSGS